MSAVIDVARSQGSVTVTATGTGTHPTDSGTGLSGSRKPPQKRRSIRLLGPEKKIGEDEFMASAIGDVEWLKQSIRGNRGVINYDKNGLAPIHLAAIHGRLDCLRLLIEKFKVDVNLPSKTGWRPIHLVISNQTGRRAFQCLCYLLSHEADPSITNEDGITPMHQAASEGHVQCMKALIEVGAEVKAVDYRGHTPLDLAKLWGHRKCARILAAEEWHQDKEFLAREMNQLEKLKMQQVLLEIEADQENKAHQEFYGDLAFKDWLSSRGLEPRPTGPNQRSELDTVDTPKRTLEEQPPKKQVTLIPTAKKKDQETPYKANSVQRPTAQVTVSGPSSKQTRAPPQPKQVMSTPAQSRTLGLDTAHKPAEPARRATQTKHDEKPSEVQSSAKIHNQTSWNKSTKIQPKEYVPILKDHYPHDEYTMMPKHAPKRLSKTPTMLEDSADEEGVEDRSKYSRTPEPRSNERPVVYKCKHIADIHKKKHYDGEFLPKSELGMHLANDPRSQLFQRGLLQTNRDELDLSNVQNMDLMSMMNLMERMTKPTHFPPIKGAQYDLHVEQKG